MKVCPECATQYEDHVPTCIADGAVLLSSVSSPAPPAAPAPPSPAPLEPPARASIAWILPVVGGLFLMGSVVVLASVLLAVGAGFGRSWEEPPEPVVAPRVEAPPPAPEKPKEQPPVQIVLNSVPPGAKVYENDQYVCDTPCSVQHPAHAPLPRFFAVKATGYKDGTLEMTSTTSPLTIELSRRSTTSNPSPSPTTPRPSIGRER